MCSITMRRVSSEFCRCASGNPAFRRSLTPKILAARSASSARREALPRVPLSPAVRSRIPILYPASMAFNRVPAQVSSTSSRWAARARMSTGILEYRSERTWCAEVSRLPTFACARVATTRISCAPQGGIVRAQIMIVGLLQAALLTACDRNLSKSEPEQAQRNLEADAKSASPVPLGVVGGRPTSQAQAPKASEDGDTWSRYSATAAGDRLIVRTGQAGIEVDSLETAIAELRRVAQRVGGFVADASVQSGRNQVRSATCSSKCRPPGSMTLLKGCGRWAAC